MPRLTTLKRVGAAGESNCLSFEKAKTLQGGVGSGVPVPDSSLIAQMREAAIESRESRIAADGPMRNGNIYFQEKILFALNKEQVEEVSGGTLCSSIVTGIGTAAGRYAGGAFGGEIGGALGGLAGSVVPGVGSVGGTLVGAAVGAKYGSTVGASLGGSAGAAASNAICGSGSGGGGGSGSGGAGTAGGDSSGTAIVHHNDEDQL